MSTTNSKTRTPSTVTRKRQTVRAVSRTARPVAKKKPAAESVQAEASFKAVLTACEKRVTARAPRKRAASSRAAAVSPAVNAAIDEHTAALAQELAQDVVRLSLFARVWSWLRSKKSPQQGTSLSLVEQPSPSPATLAIAESAKMLAARSASRRAELVSEPAQPAIDSHPNAMNRAFTWLQTRYTMTTAKRLRVVENVTLGEKRFVALVTVDGREFLIGGGSHGVALLADLGSAHQPVASNRLAAAVVSE